MGKLGCAWFGAWRGAWVVAYVYGIGEAGLGVGSCLDGEGGELDGGVSCT